MKLGYFVATALLSSTIISTPAFADSFTPPTANAADATTLGAMQDQCDAVAALHGPSTGDNDHWTGVVVEGDVPQVGTTTEVDGTRVIDHSSIVGTGTYVPAALEIRAGPYKTGGSQNMFGDQWSTAGYYPDSTYNFTADFNSTFAHAYSCDINQEVYHAGYDIQHHLEGYYYPDNSPGANCDAFNAKDYTWPQWGDAQAHCSFQPTSQPWVEHVDAVWDAPIVTNVPQTAINQDQTDSIDAVEDHGGRVDVTGEYFVGKTVICISPGPKGGTWKAQNGYSGGSMTGPAAGCNTPYFKIAPTNSGTTTSQGTFNSVPNYNLP